MAELISSNTYELRTLKLICQLAVEITFHCGVPKNSGIKRDTAESALHYCQIKTTLTPLRYIITSVPASLLLSVIFCNLFIHKE